MRGDRAFIVYRVLCRLNEQCAEAYRYGRLNDARDIGVLIGKLEYQHFGAVSFENSLGKVA